MHPYARKKEAARQQLVLSQFPIVQDVDGRCWSGARYHIMYTDYFIGYFLYKIAGLIGEIDEYGGDTWWGFEIQMATHAEHGEDYEQPLPCTEVKAWLSANFGHLTESTDYEHLVDILALNAAPDGRNIAHIQGQHNWTRAMQWLEAQCAQTITPQVQQSGYTTGRSENNQRSPWEYLLRGRLPLDGFFAYLQACELLTASGVLTSEGRGSGPLKARKATWVGALQALIDAGLLEANTAAICRALADPLGKIGVKLSENTLRTPSEKATKFCVKAAAILAQLNLLRN